MHLTREEEEVLSRGDARSRALETVVKVGESLGASRLLDVETAHVSGVSYQTIGDAGVEFLSDLAASGARFKVFATVNPMGMELDGGETPVDDLFKSRQLEVVKSLIKMGASAWFTCAPYDIIRTPPGTVHAWGESNAISYINSVRDAMSEKLPGPFTILAAITGKVPEFGLYLHENRMPRVMVKVNGRITQAAAGIIGKMVGEFSGSRVPYVVVGPMTERAMKAMLASFATYSPNPFMVIEGVNPNWRLYRSEMDVEESLVIDEKDLRLPETRDFDAVFIGCPHADLDEVLHVAKLLEDRGYPRLAKPLFISTSRFVKSQLSPAILSRLDELNVHVITDTCPIVSPFLRNRGLLNIATPSSKSVYYMPRLVSLNAMPCEIDECIGDLL
ncbi:acetyltransferase [Thermocladium modestius]|uniref:Phosphomevalonate dehydratase large subunit n=1 Tax=Thermocladium modestius TaxID=62609 RepID=A0A830GX14_9CREN|nr:aconitase X catalytic domain-containing protein [Thermocladium modestius]GGP21400.1 acetyltransferase [Thermocladium modestius]